MGETKLMKQIVLQKQSEVENWSTEQILGWAYEKFGAGLALASSFGAEDVVLIDLLSRLGLAVPVFTLDTNFLFAQTYELIGEIQRKYGITVERLLPTLTPEAQADRFGEALWTREPDKCCHIRKMEPLALRLSKASAWITGIRREQAATRANSHKLEWDEKFGLVKLNPVADWTSAQIWEYIRANAVPYNPLHDRGYPSIGCTHCTRQVLPGEDPRAGRWSGFSKTECGLHFGESGVLERQPERSGGGK